MHTIMVTATDDAGNSATCTTTFTVVDATPPTVNCPAGTSANANANCQAPIPNVLGGVTASDNCDTSLTLSQSPAAGTLVGLGMHTITVRPFGLDGKDKQLWLTLIARTRPPRQ